MNQLSEPNINNEDVFIAVAKSKKFQNGHCEKCNEATPDCETCTYGNRGKMLALKEWVFERYNFYTQNKNNLNAIKPIDIMRERWSSTYNAIAKTSVSRGKSEENSAGKDSGTSSK